MSPPCITFNYQPVLNSRTPPPNKQPGFSVPLPLSERSVNKAWLVVNGKGGGGGGGVNSQDERRVGSPLDANKASGPTWGLPSPFTVFRPLRYFFNLKGKNRVEHHVRAVDKHHTTLQQDTTQCCGEVQTACVESRLVVTGGFKSQTW